MDDQTSALLISNLINKALTKQQIYRTTLETFQMMKKELLLVSSWIQRKTLKIDKQLKVKYTESGDFQAELKFATDTLIFMMHTNVFNFPEDHFIYKNAYVRQDPFRTYCGSIMIYNFLSDSLKYNRTDDVGYLMARIFVNKEKHFFIQGQRQYSFMFRDFPNLVVDKANVRRIILTSIQQAIEFDLLVPPLETINQITVSQKLAAEGNFALKTGKRLGFSIENLDEDNG